MEKTKGMSLKRFDLLQTNKQTVHLYDAIDNMSICEKDTKFMGYQNQF